MLAAISRQMLAAISRQILAAGTFPFPLVDYFSLLEHHHYHYHYHFVHLHLRCYDCSYPFPFIICQNALSLCPEAGLPIPESPPIKSTNYCSMSNTQTPTDPRRTRSPLACLGYPDQPLTILIL